MQNAMIRMDRAGRLVLPKPVRDRFRLRAGARLELELHDDHLRLRPAAAEPALARVDGWWVHQGEPEAGASIEEAVARHRQERIEDASR